MESTPREIDHGGGQQNPLPPAIAHLIDLIPQTDLCMTAVLMAYKELPLPVFYHSLRVYLYGNWLVEQDTLEETPGATSWNLKHPRTDVLFVACILHDIGVANEHDGPCRFEVEGANAAAEHLQRFNHPIEDVREAWIAIACHSTPHIPERIGPLPRLVRVAVLSDFAHQISEVSHTKAKEFELRLPRLNVEEVLARAVVGQALNQRSKAPSASWPHALLVAHDADPSHVGINPAF